MVPHPLVEVWWTDAHPVPGWLGFDSIPSDPRMIRSCGYLVPDAVPGHHFIVQSFDVAAETFDAGLAIPDGMVKQVRYLAEL